MKKPLFFYSSLLGIAFSAMPPLPAGTDIEPPRKYALFVSYDTPTTNRGLDGRFELVRKLKAQGFETTIVSDRFPDHPHALVPTPENFLAAFDRLAADPKVGDLAIIIDLHGLPRKKGERSHTTLFGDAGFSLDRLRPGLRRLKKRRARVVLLDLSCYSGATLSLAREGACVATDGSRRSENYPQFLDGFAASLRPGIRFEEVFLDARRTHLMPRTPRISSDAGRFAIASENVIERAFAQESRAGALRFEDRVSRLSWTDAEKAAVAESYARWRTNGEIVPFGQFPPYAQATLRYLPLVSAERSFYERNFLKYRANAGLETTAERAAGRACVDFTF